MASSNVEYYQRQKELQNVIHEHESRRANLEQQLKVLAKTDNRLAKLRAAKLKSYWKKICDDQKRAQERNDRIVQEFERIDTFLAASTARTEKLRLLKRQYEEYIEKTYPLWMEQVLHHRQQTQPSHASPQGVTPQYSQPSHPHQQPAGYRDSNPQSATEARAGPPPMEPPRAYTDTHTPVKQTYNQQIEGPEERDSYGHVLTSTPFRGDSQYTQKPKSSSIYANISQVMRDPAEMTQQQSQTRTGHQQVTHVPAERETTPQRLSEQVADISISDDVVEEMVQHPQPIQSVRIGQQVHKPVPESPDVSQSLSGPMEPQPGDEGAEDVVSDFGDDDLPLSTSQTGPEPPKKIVSQEQMSPPSSPDATPRDPPIQTAVTEADSSPGTPSPDMILDGLMRLIVHVQEDFPDALSHEGYYRSHRPSASDRRDIMHKANKGIPLYDQDAEKISMVLLEQLPLVVRNVSNKGLLPDSILSGSIDSITEMKIRMALPEAAQPLWDCLFNHLALLVRNKVMVTKEVAAVFVPSLVADYSPYQDKAYNLLICLLDKFDEDRQTDGDHAITPRDNMDSMRSSLGGVPPLKFGSLVDKQFGSDDESTTMLTPSVPTDAPKVPLNETAAYRNMLSGTMTSQSRQPVHVDDEDTDDDVEKQFASALSPRDPPSTIPPPKSFANPTDSKPDNQAEPLSDLSSQPSPVYVPTAIQKQSVKSALGSTAGSTKSQPRKVGIQFSSDLDTDTEPEIPMGRKTEEEKDDFYDFYE